MRRPLAFTLLALTTSAPLVLSFSACSSSTTSVSTTSDASADGASEGATPGAFELEVPCKDAADALYGDPGTLPKDKGAIIKCTKATDIAKADLEARAKANDGYTGKPFTSGAKVYKVLYRTERGDPKSTPGYSAAMVYVPDTPRD